MGELKPHKKFYLRFYSHPDSETAWCEDKINDDDIVYVKAGNKQKQIDEQALLINQLGMALEGMSDELYKNGIPDQALSAYSQWKARQG